MRRIEIALPGWIDDVLTERNTRLTDPVEQMELVLALAERNIRSQTGGPFAAAIFAIDSGHLLSAGVNLVAASHCSIAHAEMVAIASAQQDLGVYDLGQVGDGGCVLVSSAEPCAMCMGAIPWAGIAHLICAAGDRDVRAIGFDEGNKPTDWAEDFMRRGIRVTRKLLRERAVAILQAYASSGGKIYAPHHQRPSTG